MGCIRIDRVLDYLIEPLKRGVKDSSPYVRKTCALCIAKVFDLNIEIGEDCGFVDDLKGLLLTDSNPMVVSNVIAALSDIQDTVGAEVFSIDEEVFGRLVLILGDCTEWGQVFIIDALSKYKTESVSEIEKMIEIVLPKLQHANQAVVMSSICLLTSQSPALPESHQLRTVILRKLSSPLISILSPPTPAEIQYVALRNVNILLKSFSPKLFTNDDISVFFCNYNDSQYVKLEKIEIIGLIVNDNNIKWVLDELSEYSKDVDMEIVKKSIWILSECALKVPRWSRSIGEIFRELASTGIPHILQQITINLKKLIRNRATFHEFLPIVSSFFDSNAAFEQKWQIIFYTGNCCEKSQISMIWLVGEVLLNPLLLSLNLNLTLNNNNLSDSDSDDFHKILSNFIKYSNENFQSETGEIQNEIISSFLKIFINLNRFYDQETAEETPFFINWNELLSELSIETMASYTDDSQELMRLDPLHKLILYFLQLGINFSESLELRDRCHVYKKIFKAFESENNNRIKTGLSKSSNNNNNESGNTVPLSLYSFEDDNGFNMKNTNTNVNNTQNADVLEKIICTIEKDHNAQDEEEEQSVSQYDTYSNNTSTTTTTINGENMDSCAFPLNTLSSVYHQQPAQFLKMSSAKTTREMIPNGLMKLLRHGRPAVANLLDLNYNLRNESTISSTSVPTSPSDLRGGVINQNQTDGQQQQRDKYSNLLDLLD